MSIKYVVMESYPTWTGPVAVCESPDDAERLVGKIVAKISMDRNYGAAPPSVYFVPLYKHELAP